VGEPARPVSSGALLDIDEPQASGEGVERPYDCYVPRPVLRWLATAPEQTVQTVEGTMMFADVSGFTRLSERLARTGREGAERLVDTITGCWTALLADAYALGGSLQKFGGDALLLWFEGPEHAMRAGAAAFAMRRKLKQVGRIRVGSSQVVLRMSVGVHSGTFQMFLVGDSHREHLIGGEATTIALTMEKRASAGQILVSAATAAALPNGWLGSACGSGTLLGRVPAMPALTPAVLARPPQEAVLNCLSNEIRAQVTSTGVSPEHRTATIAFIECGKLDAFIADHGPQAAADGLDTLVRAAQRAADRYRVCFLASDVAPDGARILLSAGAPRVLGDDEERLLLALRDVIESEQQLPVRIGVNRGHVFTGEVGPPYRRTYVAMGDTTNLAARLMAKASWGTIYATRGVLEQSQWRFQTDEVPPFMVKGKTRPIQAWDVGPARRAVATGQVGRRLPLRGRDRELKRLHDAIDQARRGRGSLIELVGETGSGKSRLLAEARDAASDMRLMHGTCEVYTQQTPHAVWREPLRELVGLGFDDPPDRVLEALRAELKHAQPDLLPWLPLLAIAFGVDAPSTRAVDELAPEARPAKLHEVVLAFLGRALVVPTLLQIEHGHFMGAASAALLEALAAELDSSAWVVLVTRREGTGGFATGTANGRVELGPLSESDLRAVAEAAPEAARLPPHVFELAVSRAGGSPEFLLDLLASADSGVADLPDNVGAAAMARIDALEPGDRSLVRRASVLGLSFDPRHLERVLEDSPPPDEQDWARLSAVFARDPDGHVRFKRPALQEAAHASLPFKLRRALHATAAATIEVDPDLEADPAVLSLHLLLADEHARAYRFALLGAERATARFSHADAAQLYRRAIDCARAAGFHNDAARAPAIAHAWEQLGESLRCTGEPAAAAGALTAARRLLRDDAIAQARLCHRHAEVAERSEAKTAAVRWLKRGLRCIDGIESEDATRWRARLRSYLGGVRNWQGRFAESVRLCDRAISEAESVGELPALARSCYTLDWALFELGRTDEVTHSARALEIYGRLGDPEHESTVLNNLGMFAYFEGRWDDAIELYRQAGDCSQRAGRPSDTAYTDCNIGEILSDQGRLRDASSHLEQAKRIWTATGDQHSVAFASALLGRLAVRDGRWREGYDLLENARTVLRGSGIGPLADFVQALLAEAEAFGGDPSRALSIIEGLELSGPHRPLIGRLTGIALARQGKTEASREELTNALVVSRRQGADYDVAATIEALAALGPVEDELVTERDAILARLKIERLPLPAWAH
jgi:class 3 adenylate cyclase/tetratricopeptide (TPR) repeat protein